MEKKGRKIEKQDTGITLVALVITIIIIIILATVTINMAFGDNGLIKQAQLAKDMTANSVQTEQENMNSLMQEYSNVMAEDSELASKYDIFVYLYDDGTLTFGTQNEPIERKNVVKEYGNIKGQEYSVWLDENSNLVSDIPWFNEASSIIKVSIIDEVVPLSMSYWFYSCVNLIEIENIQNIDTSKTESMVQMFANCESLTSLNLSSFNTNNVKNMARMFGNCSNLTSINLSSFNTSSVIDMSSMFWNCRALINLNLNNFDTSNVENMESMFNSCVSLISLDLSSFDTSNVTDMKSMFNSCSSLTILDLGNFNTRKVENMSAMFYGCTKLTTIYVGDNWDLSNADTTNMFGGCGTSTTIPKGSNS